MYSQCDSLNSYYLQKKRYLLVILRNKSHLLIKPHFFKTLILKLFFKSFNAPSHRFALSVSLWKRESDVVFFLILVAMADGGTLGLEGVRLASSSILSTLTMKSSFANLSTMKSSFHFIACLQSSWDVCVFQIW